MNTPLHPMIVHLPMALSILMPFVVIFFALMIKYNKMSSKGWLFVVGLQLLMVITGYVALETGETEEDIVEKVLPKKYIHDHEEAAEIFVGSTVISLVLSIAAFLIRKDLSFILKITIAFVGVISSFLAYRVGSLGGEIVYVHGAGKAYLQDADQENTLLPTPQMNTSESENPDESSESLKIDENDYGSFEESFEDSENMDVEPEDE